MIRNIHSPSKVSFIQCLSFTTSSQLGRVNPLTGTGNYSAMSNNTKLVHWPLMGGLLHLVRRGGDWAGPQSADWAGPQSAQAPPRCTKCNSHPSTASVPITVLQYNDPLLCGFNMS